MRPAAAIAASANASMLARSRTSSAIDTARRPIDSTSALRVGAALGVARRQDEVGAVARERAGELAAEAAARAGDDRRAALELERSTCLHGCRITFIRPGSRA